RAEVWAQICEELDAGRADREEPRLAVVRVRGEDGGTHEGQRSGRRPSPGPPRLEGRAGRDLGVGRAERDGDLAARDEDGRRAHPTKKGSALEVALAHAPQSLVPSDRRRSSEKRPAPVVASVAKTVA